VQRQVDETLGVEFDVISVEIRRGSITVLIVIGTVGSILMTFSHYENFIKSMNLLVSQAGMKDLSHLDTLQMSPKSLQTPD
jgi:hypothetical protein